MKVICINNGLHPLWLTIGKVYDVIIDKNDIASYILYDDGGWWWSHKKDKFLLIEDAREDKLNKILNG